MSDEFKFKVGDKVRRVSGGAAGVEFVIGKIGVSPHRTAQPCAWPQGADGLDFHHLKNLELVVSTTLEDELKGLESKVLEVKAKIAERDAPKAGDFYKNGDFKFEIVAVFDFQGDSYTAYRTHYTSGSRAINVCKSEVWSDGRYAKLQ